MVTRPVASLLPFALAFTLSGCGSIGLDVMEQDQTSAGPADAQVPADQVSVGLSGRTYSAFLADMTVLEPAGLQALIPQVADEELLFHVVAEGSGLLDIVMALAAEDGTQNPCEPVYDLPRADWSSNPEFVIEDGETEIQIGGKPVLLGRLDLEAHVTTDGSLWDDAVLTAVIDTRDLLGGSLSTETDVCELVENMGGECLACADGAMACATLSLKLQAEQVDVDFDAGLEPEGC
jgi:hypothetical protein